MKGEKIEVWVKAGYKLLASDGLDQLRVERVARLLDLNKSGFYHYFGSMESYMKCLFEHHITVAKMIAKEMSDCQTIDPDLLAVIVKHKMFFQVDSHLLAKSKFPNSRKSSDEARLILSAEILPLWIKTMDAHHESSLTEVFSNILQHFFYARINSENINYKFLHQLTTETQDVLSKVVKGGHVLHDK